MLDRQKNCPKTGKNTMTPLDKTDLKILEALQNNAKINAKTLAADLHLSKTPIYERIRRMEDEGVIKQYVALVDPEKIGLPLVVFCNVTLSTHDEEHIRQFEKAIQEIDEVMECYSIGGIHDFFLKVVVRDLKAYDRFVFEKLTTIKGISKMQSSFVLNEMKHTTALKPALG